MDILSVRLQSRRARFCQEYSGAGAVLRDNRRARPEWGGGEKVDGEFIGSKKESRNLGLSNETRNPKNFEREIIRYYQRFGSVKL